MANFAKGSAVFKYRAEDFIVEEINRDGRISEISKSISDFENAKIDFANLDVNDRRDFLMADMEKINIDHFNAMSILCNELNKHPHEIGYAGNKDKVAWTCQRISIFNPYMDKIKNFSYKGIILKNFRWGKHKLKIGDLKGNKFTIILRDIDKESIKVLNRVRNIEYIPNYFGSQRFGSVRKDNFQIGRMILQRRYKEAVRAYLTGFGEKESKEVKEAKRKLKLDKNIFSAKGYFPKELYTENRMIEHLSKNRGDFLGALMQIDEKILLIMCQSVQSRLFNDMLEKAIERRVIKEKDSISIPGYNANNSESKLRRIEKDVLEQNEIDLEDFRNPDIQFLTLAGTKRKAFFKVKDIIIEVDKDEIFNPAEKIKLLFCLEPGSYATSFLEYFFDLR